MAKEPKDQDASKDLKPSSNTQREWFQALRAFAVVIEATASVVGSALVGYALDQRFNTSPYIFLVLMVAGCFTAGWLLWRLAKQTERELEP
ncbi:MAG: AtpZ/AtpI family protein [Myxococcales bacterium]|nr:AtpZ/AtpI family protein [Myxococcales bacterium]